MGNRESLKLKDKYPYIRWHKTWPRVGIGRYWKRCLSKARRRYAKEELRGATHPRTPTHYESEVNYRTY